MRAADAAAVGLVVAAQAGDRHAVEELVTTHLPLVYNLVGRALSGHPDVDDVVQETMVRALRDLPALRTPESVRPWLVTIAIRQVATHRQRRAAAAARTAALADAVELPGADFEDLTILRLRLSGERRRVVRAGRWLDGDDRALLSLWWLEVTGHLTRAELAAATGLTEVHAAVRVQRMRSRLDLSRSLVAALEATPRCAGLDAAVAGWDGRPNPLWRKRIARHVRSCVDCGRAGAGAVPAEHLLLGLGLVPVPVTLAAGLVAKSASTATVAPVKAGLVAQFVHAVGAHPVLAIALTGALATGTATAVAATPADAPPVAAIQSPAAAGPSAVGAQPVPLGWMSLESANEGGRFVAFVGDVGALAPIAAGSAESTRQSATLRVVAGLAGAGCVSFQSRDGRYLRHASWRVRLSRDEGTVLFRGDATFCARPGSLPGSVSWESSNYPGWFLRHVGADLWVDRSDGTEAVRADGSFLIRPPLGG